ncbi:MarR family winged helix-turn-helix transcriptional regulator [Streptomyces tsukubensis]|nr:MarR family winged helix-turn-helix transcriptional regulator [Streptomyces tsukubensis]QFR96322.1 MarR family transcriptional regulator [Streptomyces tsukubensis]
MTATRPFTLEALPEPEASGPLAPVREALLGLVGEYLLDFEQAAESEQLTQAQARVLGFAVRGMSMRQIAHQFGCDPSNITGKVDRLVALGLVERRPDPRDARIKRVVATDKGRAKAVRLCERRTWLSTALGRLESDEVAHVQHALGLLGRMAQKSGPEQKSGPQLKSGPGPKSGPQLKSGPGPKSGPEPEAR